MIKEQKLRFNKKYVRNSDKAKQEHQDKIALSDDAFAIGEILEEFMEFIKRRI